TVFSLLAFFKSFYFLQKRGWKFFDMYFGLFILDWITIVAFIFFIAWSTKKLLNKQVRWRTIVILHFILAFLVNAGIRFVFEIYGFVQAGRPLVFSELLDRYLAYIDTNFLLYAVMVFIIYGFYYT